STSHKKSPGHTNVEHSDAAPALHEVHFRHRRRGLVAREGHCSRIARAAARRTRIARDDVEIRPVHQRRSRHDVRGLRVTMMKFDPYINVDPGTMSPFQHGEVFVTDDGAE